MWNLIYNNPEKIIVDSFSTFAKAKNEFDNRVGLCYTLHAKPLKIYSVMEEGKNNARKRINKRAMSKVRKQ